MNLLDRLSTAYAFLSARLHAAVFGPTPYDGTALRARLASFDYVGTAIYFTLLAGFLACFVVPMCGCAVADANLLAVPALLVIFVAAYGLRRLQRKRDEGERARKRDLYEASRACGAHDVFYTYPVGVPSTALPRPEASEYLSVDETFARIRAEANEDARRRERELFTAPGPDLTTALLLAASVSPSNEPTYAAPATSSCDSGSSGGGCE